MDRPGGAPAGLWLPYSGPRRPCYGSALSWCMAMRPSRLRQASLCAAARENA